MRMSVNDGVAIFATHFIRAAVDREIAREKLAPYQVEVDGIVVYPGQDVLTAEKALKELGISYLVEELKLDPAHITKTQGIKYGSRSEAIAHMVEGKEPDSLIIPNLRTENTALKAENVTLKTDLTTLKNDFNSLKTALVTKGVITGILPK